MIEWKDYFSVLRCVNCGGHLRISSIPKKFGQYSSVNAELICLSCGRCYPIFQDIPMIFKDDNRIQILIDSTVYENHLKKARKAKQQASWVTSDELGRFKKGNDSIDALSWEMLFWERWKQSDRNFLDFTRENVEECLRNDADNRHRLQFFNRVVSFCNDIPKRMLNIGAGRDLLLEKFLDHGYEVVEQDILLESLLTLKKRGASFCVCCDVRALPFDDNAFDIGTSFEVLHHIQPIEEPIAELLRVISGDIHFNEPNYFALIRAAFLFPGFLKRKLKRFYQGDYVQSPYEDSINLYLFRRIVASLDGEIVDLSFNKDSWIPKQSVGVKRLLRIANLILVNLVSLASAHFDAVVIKKQNGHSSLKKRKN